MTSEQPRPHKVSVHDTGGCCEDHPSHIVAFCEDCDDTVGGGDWTSANEEAQEHVAAWHALDSSFPVVTDR